MKVKENYGTAIRSGFEYLLSNYPDVFIIGQGLWSPWYVGNTMTDLDKKYGKDRVIDTPVSEAATTSMAIGASLCGSLPIVVHPRIDFMLYAMDPIANQAAKWSYMFGGQASPSVTIRAIINRGGEQGAQHSQSLHAWLAHIPGLRVVMPYSVEDARDMLIASVLCPDPVIYIDDRWLYEKEEKLSPIEEKKINNFPPKKIKSGNNLTIVGSSFSTQLALDAARELEEINISAEVIDIRTLSPFKADNINDSVSKTGKLIVVDGGTKHAGFAAEVIATVVENCEPNELTAKPLRVTLPDTPAPTSRKLEKIYYPTIGQIIENAKVLCGKDR